MNPRICAALDLAEWLEPSCISTVLADEQRHIDAHRLRRMTELHSSTQLLTREEKGE